MDWNEKTTGTTEGCQRRRGQEGEEREEGQKENIGEQGDSEKHENKEPMSTRGHRTETRRSK